MSSESNQVTVLVVDDEREVADVYALRLRGEYETRTAYGGEEALEELDPTVDVVLLDRRMPDIPGDDVLAEIRSRQVDCRVIMLTAVDPGMDILEMDFDDYLCKPVEKADLVSVIDQQIQAQRYDERLSEYLEVSSKLALLEAELSTQEVDENEELQELSARAEELRSKIDQTIDGFDDMEAAFREIRRHPE